jgi:hypothetical protein
MPLACWCWRASREFERNLKRAAEQSPSEGMRQMAIDPQRMFEGKGRLEHGRDATLADDPRRPERLLQLVSAGQLGLEVRGVVDQHSLAGTPSWLCRP